MDTLLKLNTQTAGRDKLIRLLQYLNRFLWHRIQQVSDRDIEKLRSLEYTLSTFRKLLRWGRCADVLYSVLPIMHHPDPTIRMTVTLSKISNSLFLFADHIIWLSRSGVCNFDVEKWGRVSNKYWLFSLTMNLVRDFYEISCILEAEKSFICPRHGHKTVNDIFTSGTKAFTCVRAHKDVMTDTVKNLCDFFIPLTALGYTKLSPSVVGCLGVVSSMAGLLALVDTKYKLAPV